MHICDFVGLYACMCLRATTVVMRHHDHKLLWGKRFVLFTLSHHWPPQKGLGQGLKQGRKRGRS